MIYSSSSTTTVVSFITSESVRKHDGRAVDVHSCSSGLIIIVLITFIISPSQLLRLAGTCCWNVFVRQLPVLLKTLQKNRVTHKQRVEFVKVSLFPRHTKMTH